MRTPDPLNRVTIGLQEEQAIEQIQIAIRLVATRKALIRRMRIVGVVWTWAVAREIRVYAREWGIRVWLTDSGENGLSTIEIAPDADHEVPPPRDRCPKERWQVTGRSIGADRSWTMREGNE